jgi:excisionase family DNA binding protein
MAAAAEYTGLTGHAIRKLIDRSQIPKTSRCGGRIMLRRDDLDRYLEGART